MPDNNCVHFSASSLSLGILFCQETKSPCFQGSCLITAVTTGTSGGAPGPALGFGMYSSLIGYILSEARSVSSAIGGEGSELALLLDDFGLCCAQLYQYTSSQYPDYPYLPESLLGTSVYEA